MPEDAAPAEAQETPEAPEAASQETPAPVETTDWQKRYEDLRPEYDRGQQRLSQFEEFYAQLADPETQAEALRALGLELEQEEAEEGDDYIDPDDRFAKIEDYITQQETARQEAEVEKLERQYIDQELSALEEEHGELDDTQRDFLRKIALAYEDDEGFPDVASAYEAAVTYSKASQQRYLKSKRSEKPEQGTASVESVDMGDEDSRRNAVAAEVAAAMAAEE